MISFLFSSKKKNDGDDDDDWSFDSSNDNNHNQTNNDKSKNVILKMPAYVERDEEFDESEGSPKNDCSTLEAKANGSFFKANRTTDDVTSRQASPVDGGVPFFWSLHRATCLERGSLVASVAQVAEYDDLNHLRSEENTTTTWKRPIRKHAIVWQSSATTTLVDDLMERINKDKERQNEMATPSKSDQTKSRPSSSSPMLWIKQSLFTSFSPTLQRVDSLEDELEKFDQQDAAAAAATATNDSNQDENDSDEDDFVNVNNLLVNLELLRECVDQWHAAVTDAPAPTTTTTLTASNDRPFTNDSTGNIQVLVADPDMPQEAKTGYCHWKDWCQTHFAEKSLRVSTTNETIPLSQLLLRLPKDQMNLLWCLLERRGVVRIFRRRPQQPDLLVLLNVSCHVNEDTKQKEAMENCINVAITKFDLSFHMQRLIHSSQDADSKAAQCLERAKAAKQQHNSKRAALEMKRRQLYQDQSTRDMQAHFNLQTMLHTLESTAQQAATIQALQQARGMFKTLRQDATLEEMDSVLTGLEDEMELSRQVDETMAKSLQSTTGVAAFDEDELLKELQNLQLEDSASSRGTGDGNNGGAGKLTSLEALDQALPVPPQNKPMATNSNLHQYLLNKTSLQSCTVPSTKTPSKSG